MASFPPFLELMHFALDLNRGHKLTGLHHLTRPNVAVIYCNNFHYGQGVKWLHFSHGSHGYSQTEVPAFKFMPLHNYCHLIVLSTGCAIVLVVTGMFCLGSFGLLTIVQLVC